MILKKLFFSPIPIPLANADGSRRVTQKSKLSDVCVSHYNAKDSFNHVPQKHLNSVNIVDLMAHIRTNAKPVTDTFEDFILKIILTLPNKYPEVYLIADAYQEQSIKNSERLKRGSADKSIGKINKIEDTT